MALCGCLGFLRSKAPSRATCNAQTPAVGHFFFFNAERRTKELMRGRQRGFVAFGGFSLTKIVDGMVVDGTIRARGFLLRSDLDFADLYS